MPESKCPRCTEPLASAARFCPRCGIEVQTQPVPRPPPRIVAPPPPRVDDSYRRVQRPKPAKKSGMPIWVFAIIGIVVVNAFRHTSSRPKPAPPKVDTIRQQIDRDLANSQRRTREVDESLARRAAAMRTETDAARRGADLANVEREDAPRPAAHIVPRTATRIVYVVDVPAIPPAAKALLKQSINSLSPGQSFTLIARDDDTLAHAFPGRLAPAAAANRLSATALLDSLDRATPFDAGKTAFDALRLTPDLLILVADPAAQNNPSTLEGFLKVFRTQARINVIFTRDADTPYGRSLRAAAQSTGGTASTIPTR